MWAERRLSRRADRSAGLLLAVSAVLTPTYLAYVINLPPPDEAARRREPLEPGGASPRGRRVRRRPRHRSRTRQHRRSGDLRLGGRRGANGGHIGGRPRWAARRGWRHAPVGRAPSATGSPDTRRAVPIPGDWNTRGDRLASSTGTLCTKPASARALRLPAGSAGASAARNPHPRWFDADGPAHLGVDETSGRPRTVLLVALDDLATATNADATGAIHTQRDER